MDFQGIRIGEGRRPFIVAEIGANHGGNLAHAKSLMATAKKVGADAVKFQAYTPDALVGPRDSISARARIHWQGSDVMLWDLYADACTPYGWFKEIAVFAEEIGIRWFSSVFDTRGLEVLEQAGCPCYKIASLELNDIPLLRIVSATGKPMILSTGTAYMEDILRARDEVLTRLTADKIALLHCVSGYPTPVNQANLPRMQVIRELFKPPYAIGLSDHTEGINVPIAAAAQGAHIVEKHLRGAIAAADYRHSIGPSEFGYMVSGIQEAWQATRKAYQPPCEEQVRPLRRSLFSSAMIKKDQQFSPTNVRTMRCDLGLDPSYYDVVLKSIANCDIPPNTPLETKMITVAR
jgi:pseudaminic acid synthase